MNLDLNPKNGQLRRTKIIATLGPATDDPAVLEAVIRTVIPQNRIVVTATPDFSQIGM
jgi:pyruvate kinase